MAHKKGQGSSRNGRDSQSQRLGVKRHDGNLGKDNTLFAKIAGRVKFEDHGARGRRIIVHPAAAAPGSDE
jgi:large subunit ribosomal protein L27